MSPQKSAFVLAAILLISGSSMASPADNGTPSLLPDCALDLVLPTDGLLARSAGGSSGPITVTIHLGEEGKLNSLEFRGGADLFQRQITQAMNISRFSPKCSGQTLRFVFSFIIDGQPSDSPSVWLSFASPDQFILHTHPRATEILRTRKPQ